MNLNFRERQSTGCSNYSSCQLPSVAFPPPVLSQRHKRGRAWGATGSGATGSQEDREKEASTKLSHLRVRRQREKRHTGSARGLEPRDRGVRRSRVRGVRARAAWEATEQELLLQQRDPPGWG